MRRLIDFVVATQGAYRTARRLLSVRGPRRSRSRPAPAFDRWFAEAAAAGVTAPEQMALATADPNARPSVRMVLLKGHDERGFVVYTNRTSRKAMELEANPWAAATVYWEAQSRQVRIEGAVERVGDDESLDYFHTRARASQVSAWASPQSKPVADREDLEQRVEEVEQRFAGVDLLPLPPSGAATASWRRRSSSGRAGRTACTIACATSSTAPPGTESGSVRRAFSLRGGRSRGRAQTSCRSRRRSRAGSPSRPGAALRRPAPSPARRCSSSPAPTARAVPVSPSPGGGSPSASGTPSRRAGCSGSRGRAPRSRRGRGRTSATCCRRTSRSSGEPADAEVA